MTRSSYSKASRLGVAAGLVVLSVAQAGAASAAPKSAGTIKIHAVGTSETDNSNEPKVCLFTLVGDNFDANESLSYEFALGAPFKEAPVLTGTVAADGNGSFSTAVIDLATGHYKATVLDGETNKEKVFKVQCDPVVDPPVVDPPVVDPPVVDPPVVDPPVVDPPVVDPPVVDPPVVDPPVVDPPVVGPELDPSGDPDPETDPSVEEVVLPAPQQDVVEDTTEVGNETAPEQDGTVVKDYTVTGTWESHGQSAGALPRTGANAAGVGAAGLLLIGAGLGLRRVVRPQGD